MFPWAAMGQAEPPASQSVPPGYAPAGPSPAAAQSPQSPQPPYRLAERSEPTPEPVNISLDTRPNEHPLMPALRWANQGLQEMDQNLRDYSATLVKRERGANGRVGEQECVYVKVRHQPFSVYMYFLAPPALKGQEAIYVEGANNGNMWAHGTGFQAALGTFNLKPTGAVAMRGQRYPITELGLKNLVRRLIERGGNDTKFGECEVKFLEGAKINDRPCTCIQVLHPVPRRNFLFHLARIYVDQELNLPIRYEAHDWPKTTGGEPEPIGVNTLIEEYTYLDLKLNNGFTDADFDIRNPRYRFKGR